MKGQTTDKQEEQPEDEVVIVSYAGCPCKHQWKFNRHTQRYNIYYCELCPAWASEKRE